MNTSNVPSTTSCTASVALTTFLNDLMRRKKLLPSQLATKLGISHVTVARWLSGGDVPSAMSCRKLAAYSGTPLHLVLSYAGHMPATNEVASRWPEFREYARNKYPKELDEDIITMIEDLIERRRGRTSESP